MKTPVLKRKTIITVVALLAVPVLVEAWDDAASARGRLVAHVDLWRGHYSVHTYGLPAAGRPEYVRELDARYGIKTHVDALCIVSKSQMAFADSYDRVSMAAVNHRFGHDVFQEVWDEARRDWEAKHAQVVNTK